MKHFAMYFYGLLFVDAMCIGSYLLISVICGIRRCNCYVYVKFAMCTYCCRYCCGKIYCCNVWVCAVELIIIYFWWVWFFSPDELIEPREDPLVQEIADVLREWNYMWRKLYAVSQLC